MSESLLIGSRPALQLPRPGLIMRRLRARNTPASARTADTLREVLASYQLEPLEPIHPLAGAFRSETWTVVTRAGKKVLKRYKSSLKPETIQHEHSILLKLEEANFPATRLMKDQTGQTIVTLNERHYALIDFLEGYSPFGNYIYFPSRTKWFNTTAGRAAARLHETLRGFRPQGVPITGTRSDGKQIHDLDWHVERLAEARAETPGSSAAGQPAIRAALARADWLESCLREAEGALAKQSPASGLIHGDYGPYNLMVRWGSPLVVLDFELARFEYLLSDIIRFLSSGASENGVLSPRLAAQFIEGYQSENPQIEADLRALPLVWRYMALRRVITAWWSYLKDPRPSHLDDITRRLDRLDWLEKEPVIF